MKSTLGQTSSNIFLKARQVPSCVLAIVYNEKIDNIMFLYLEALDEDMFKEK